MLILLVLLAGNPEEVVYLQKVDWIERNTTYCDQTGIVRVEQWIFWDHAHKQSRCVDWRPFRGEVVEQYGSGYRMRWYDAGRWREVRADSFQRTWTPTDPENDDRKCWPIEQRRLLFIRKATHK